MARARSRATAAGTDDAGAANAPAVLGARIRHARRLVHLTMTQVAERADCSASLISKIESSQAAPSLAMLHRIAVALNTNIARLTEEGPVDTPVLRSGQRLLVKTGGIALEPLTLPKRGGLLQANIHIIEVGAASDGQIVHAGEEIGYVLEGELELTLGDELHPIRTGDSFTFSSLVPHGYRNIGSGVARILWVNTPATF